MKFVVRSKDGTVDTRKLSEELSGLKDGQYTVVVNMVRNDRSILQNNYYWGAVVMGFCLHFKGTVNKNQMHDMLGYLFLRESYEHPINGELIEKTISTSKLNTLQMEEYLERCRRYAMEEYNLEIKTPEQTKFNYL